MKRLFTLLTLLSLVLFVIFGNLLVRSHWVGDHFLCSYGWVSGDTCSSLRCEASTARGGLRTTLSFNQRKMSRWWRDSGLQLSHRDGLPYRPFYKGKRESMWTRFDLERTSSGIEIAVPLWALLLALGALPAHRRGRKYLNHRRQTRLGLCPNCRYDLRASKDRCPECGTPIPSNTEGIGPGALTENRRDGFLGGP